MKLDKNTLPLQATPWLYSLISCPQWRQHGGYAHYQSRCGT